MLCSEHTLLRQGELRVVDVGVETAAREQLVVCAAFHDVAVPHDEDHVGVADRGCILKDQMLNQQKVYIILI